MRDNRHRNSKQGVGGLQALKSAALQYARTQLPDVLFAQGHSTYLTRHRVEAILLRTRMVAGAFSVLTLLWIALDAITLPWPEWGYLAVIRLIASVVFAFVALPPRREWNLAGALAVLALILSIPLSFFLAAQFVFQGVELTGLALINARLYDALPFIVLAGLSVYPLVVSEGLLFALVVLGLAALGPVVAGRFDWTRELTTLWVLAVILGIYAFAGMIQLHYMIALLKRASHDTLTGAFTRRSGMELLDSQFKDSLDRGLPMTLAFFDIDNFKSVNDVHGHDEGDRVLRVASQKLGRLLRQGDSVIRWGGEEFLVVMMGADPQGARIALQRVMQEWLGDRPGGDGPVTASIGVAERIRDGVQDWPQLVELADQRMYKSKSTGKARCTFSDDDVMLPGSERS
ncbi:MAG: GGDEF domain-containing protein [Alphaproteobacteria bacterium]|nr:GGDEF domain-containing protein [Alphaproteobacteria bacterium]